MVARYPADSFVNLDLLTYAASPEALSEVRQQPNYRFVQGDIADQEQVFSLFAQEHFDVVVHFAGKAMWTALSGIHRTFYARILEPRCF